MNKFLRKCVGCRKSKEKENLIRFVKRLPDESDISGKASYIEDPTGRMDGRGYYVCKDSEACMKKAIKVFEKNS